MRLIFLLCSHWLVCVTWCEYCLLIGWCLISLIWLSPFCSTRFECYWVSFSCFNSRLSVDWSSVELYTTFHWLIFPSSVLGSFVLQFCWVYFPVFNLWLFWFYLYFTFEVLALSAVFSYNTNVKQSLYVIQSFVTWVLSGNIFPSTAANNLKHDNKLKIWNMTFTSSHKNKQTKHTLTSSPLSPCCFLVQSVIFTICIAVFSRSRGIRDESRGLVTWYSQ